MSLIEISLSNRLSSSSHLHGDPRVPCQYKHSTGSHDKVEGCVVSTAVRINYCLVRLYWYPFSTVLS